MELDGSDFLRGLDALARDWADVTPIAVGRGGEHLRGKSSERAPILSGHLRGSAELVVTGTGFGSVAKVTFPGPYARYQHYELELKHPRGGEALYLLNAVRLETPHIMTLIADTYRSVL